MDLFQQIVLAQHGIVEFDLRILLLKFLTDFGFRNQDPARRPGRAACPADVVLHVLLKHRHAQVGVLQN